MNRRGAETQRRVLSVVCAACTPARRFLIVLTNYLPISASLRLCGENLLCPAKALDVARLAVGSIETSRRESRVPASAHQPLDLAVMASVVLDVELFAECELVFVNRHIVRLAAGASHTNIDRLFKNRVVALSRYDAIVLIVLIG